MCLDLNIVSFYERASCAFSPNDSCGLLQTSLAIRAVGTSLSSPFSGPILLLDVFHKAQDTMMVAIMIQDLYLLWWV